MEPYGVLASYMCLGVYFLLLSCFTTQVEGACAPFPIPIRIGNVSLSNGKVARGMELSVGGPGQTFAFLPQWGQNGNLLYGTDGFCTLRGAESWSKDGCTTFRGGAYDGLASESRKAASLDAFTEDPKWPQTSPIADTMKLNENATLINLPMGVALSDWDAQGYTPMMGIGLRTNSTVLGILKSSGKIASRTWSLFWGRGWGMTSQLDGHLIFGGYDRAKVTGKRYTQAMTANSPQCPSQLVVTVSDLTLNFPNGTSVSIFPTSKSSAIATCIDPSIPVMMRMPLVPFFDTFMNKTGNDIYNMTRSIGYHYWNVRYLPEHLPYDGDLTISFSSGLNIRVPNEQLVLPNVYFEQQTGEVLVNSTGPDLLIDSMQDVNANDMAQLGWQFLASAYLQVNLDAGQFSLWAANPTSAEDIAAMDSEDEVMDDFCAVTSNNGDIDGAGNSSSSPGTSPSQLPTLSPGNVEASGPALPTGAIVGIAVGAVVAGAVFGGLVLWFCKRKKGVSPGIRTQIGQVEGPSVAYQDKPPIYGGWSYKPELSGQTSQPHELANEGSGPRPGHQYELAG